jgi:hypothetical protein
MNPDRTLRSIFPGRFVLSSDVVALDSYLRGKGWLPPEEIVKEVARAGEGNMNCVMRVVSSPRCLFCDSTRLSRQGLAPLEAVVIGVLVGMGCGWLLVYPPKRERRISKSVRSQVIARDLTSKGLKWDSEKHHIDHVVPFSRGGDHSTRNLRVLEKEKNLRKGGKMPGFRDFLK